MSTLPYLPYGKQTIEDDDIQAVIDVLRSDWITTGPVVQQFENQFAEYIGVNHAVAVSNGTAALHAAVHAAGIKPGDEVIVPVITFVASANCVMFMGGTPVLVDVDPNTLLIDTEDVKQKITSKTKAIIAVDYAGQPCAYDELKSIAHEHCIPLISDVCHALGARYQNQMAGSIAGISCFSFHPVKHITTGEGGMVVTNDPDLADQMRKFRSHGVSVDFKQRTESNTWYYEMIDLGYNYRLTDIQCALGITQLKKFPQWLQTRQTLANQYDQAFQTMDGIQPLTTVDGNEHAYHLYVIKVIEEECGISRKELFNQLREQNIGVNVHYIPLHYHPYYKQNVPSASLAFPVAEQAYEQIISLPIHQNMTEKDASRVVDSIRTSLQKA
jgi:perosamine synthetase